MKLAYDTIDKQYFLVINNKIGVWLPNSIETSPSKKKLLLALDDECWEDENTIVRETDLVLSDDLIKTLDKIVKA